MTVKLTVSYDGTDFCGWQRQKNGISIQETIEDALYKVTGNGIKIVGSGRTDAGVHALGQIASFSVQNNISAEKYAKALNAFLPSQIRILKSEKVDDNFNACKTAKRKTYRYSIYLSDVVKPLKDRFSTQIIPNVSFDIEKAKKVADVFLGEHDFKAFCSSGSQIKTTVRKIYDFNIEKQGEDVTFTVTGNGFLYNMVRIMAGVLLMAGQGKFSVEEVLEMLKSGVKPMKIKTLSPRGLCLIDVRY